MKHGIQVGYGRTDIMPIGSVELGGLGNGPFRKSERILDTLFATCIAITDDKEQTLLLMTMDLLHAKKDMVADIRSRITAATGIPGEQIMIAVSHTHSGPDIGNPGPQTVKDYIALCTAKAPAAALAALQDRKPARVYTGVKPVQSLNFVRHYIRADGSCGSPTADNPVVAHQTQADPRLRLVRFVREGGKDILMMNWQAHPCFTGTSTRKDLSADYIGTVRSYLEVKLGLHFAFFQSACGNITARSKIKEENPAQDMESYSKLLGDEAVSMLDQLQEVRTAPLRFVRRQYACPIDHSTDHDVERARKVWDFWLNDGTLANSWPVARASGYHSPYQARAVLQRLSMPASNLLELDAVCMGELALATAPCEMFDTCGAYVKDHSPFAHTLMLAYCNGSYGYFPTRRAFEYGCYEVDTHIYQPGSAEEMADQLLDMLGELNG